MLFCKNKLYFVLLLLLDVFYLNKAAVSSKVKGDDLEVVIKIPQGFLVGKKYFTHNNKNFFGFQGIPYAKPPVGEKRFKPPEAAENWEGILDARNKEVGCIEVTPKLNGRESEDCLFVNIYTPKLPDNKSANSPLPVLIYIHGGAFAREDINFGKYGPHNFMDNDIVVAMVDYRTGPFGFLSTMDEFLYGNNGLKDQQLAIKWIKDNIKYFGGDAEKITLYGQSAGAASVGYHILSPKSKGLFRSAIQSSGTPMSSRVLQRNPLKTLYKIGKFINESISEENTSTQELVKFLRKAQVLDIKRAAVNQIGEDFIGGFYITFEGNGFTPVIEIEHEGAFITNTSFAGFSSGDFNQVPTLMGVNSEEAIVLTSDMDLFLEKLKKRDENLNLLAPSGLHVKDLKKLKEIGGTIRDFYVGCHNKLVDYPGRAIKFFSDGGFCKTVIKQGELQSRHSLVWLYEFKYHSKVADNPKFNYLPGADKVTHSEELMYLFTKNTTHYENFSKNDELTQKRMMKIWSNFVKYSNPTPVPVKLLQNVIWSPISLHNQNMTYLSISKNLTVDYNPRAPVLKMFDDLYTKFAVPPLDTY